MPEKKNMSRKIRFMMFSAECEIKKRLNLHLVAFMHPFSTVSKRLTARICTVLRACHLQSSATTDPMWNLTFSCEVSKP
jgi:hypothetical protein